MGAAAGVRAITKIGVNMTVGIGSAQIANDIDRMAESDDYVVRGDAGTDVALGLVRRSVPLLDSERGQRNSGGDRHADAYRVG